jgi:hypothetical protein
MKASSWFAAFAHPDEDHEDGDDKEEADEPPFVREPDED